MVDNVRFSIREFINQLITSNWGEPPCRYIYICIVHNKETVGNGSLSHVNPPMMSSGNFTAC